METKPDIKESTKAKGDKLEYGFAEYMKKELKYDKVRVKAHLPQKFNDRGTEADILARKHDLVREIASSSYKLLGFITAVFLIVGYGNILDESTNILLQNNWYIPGILFVIAFLIDRLNQGEYTWVECKNLKDTVDIRKIDNLLSKYKEYIDNDKKEFNIVDLIFVSAKGFKGNALKKAEDVGIKCFELNPEGNYVESKYWN